MATVIDLLRHLGEHAAPDGENALAGPVTLPAVTDSPLALPLPSPIVAAWSRLVGRKTIGHHALALSAAQTQHSVALMGHGASPHDDLLLLALSQLQRPQLAMLALVPDHETAFRQRLVALAGALGIRWLDAAQPGGRIAQAQLIFATPSDLHRRVLRYHDRAWRWLWPQLRFVALPELHCYTGAEAGHLHWLLRRVERLATHAPLQILTSLASVADVGATLARLLDRPMQVVAAPHGPVHSTLIALWRCGSDRATPMLRLAEQLNARRLAITLFGRDEAETERLRALAAEHNIDQPAEARVAIVAGVPRITDDRQRLLRSGYRLLILLAGDEPHELLFAAQPDLLLNVLPYWPLATHNPYVAAPQLTCAAVERPLEEAEIDRWAVRDLRDRLIKKGVFQTLPSGDLWQAAPEIDEPYAELDPRAIGGEPITILSPDGKPIAAIPPALQDRCVLPRQVFEPGLQIASRDDNAQTAQLAPDPAERATVVLAEMNVRVREESAARTIRFGKQTTDLLKGKVWATQQIAGLRELRPDTTQRRLAVNAPETEWLAAACWIPLVAPVPDPHTIGWALTQALPIVALAPPAALAPTYDAEHQRLYLVEAEPGGVGIADCVYHQFETLIELALQLAQACLSRPLYRRLAIAELTWLNALYGRAAPTEPVEAKQPAIAVPEKAPQPKVPVPVAVEQPRPSASVRPPAPPAEQPRPQVAAPAHTQPKPQAPQPRPQAPQVPVTAQPQPRPPASQSPATSQAQPRPQAPPTSLPQPRPQAPAPTEQPKPQVPATSQPKQPAQIPTAPRQPQPQPTNGNTRVPVADYVRAEQRPAPPAKPSPAAPVTAQPQRAVEAPRASDQTAAPAAPSLQPKSVPQAAPVARDNSAAPPQQPRAAVYNAAQPPANKPAAPLSREPAPAQPAAAPESPVRRYEDEAPPAADVVAPVAPERESTAPQTEAKPEVAAPETPPPATEAALNAEIVEEAPAPDTSQEEPAPIEQPAVLQPQPERKPQIMDLLALDQEEEAEPAVIAEAVELDEEVPAVIAEAVERKEESAPAVIEQPAELDEEEEAAPAQPAEAAHISRRRITAQYSIEDLLPPVDDEEDDEEPAAPREPQIEDRSVRIVRPERTSPPADSAPTKDRMQPAPEMNRPRTDAIEPEIDEDDEDDESLVDRFPTRREPSAAQRPPANVPQRPTRQPNQQRPFSHRSPIRQQPPQQPAPRRDDPPPRRDQPVTPRPDQRRPFPGRSEQNQPPGPPRSATPPNDRSRRFEPRPQPPSKPPQRDTGRPAPPRQQQPAAPEPEADVNAMIARMRRLRQEREAAQQPTPQSTQRTEQPASAEPVELRFHIGERVQCLPYGIGTVRASRIVGGREQVLIDFPEYGEIEVDPALNLIRQLGPASNAGQEDLDE